MTTRFSEMLARDVRLGRLVVMAVVALSLGLGLALAPDAALATTFTVTKTTDTNDGTCDADCSLREAVAAANAAAGADTIAFAASLNGQPITLTRTGSDDNNVNGDLDVTGAIIITGNGESNTIIQAGTNNTNGIDKIFSFNPLGSGTGFTVNMSSLTLRYGKNPESPAGNGFGGCFDFDAGVNGAGSLTLSHVTVTDCSSNFSPGGGFAVFLDNANHSTVTISDSTIQNNKASDSNPSLRWGGGIYIGRVNSGHTANVTITSSTISNNQAVGTIGDGGGIYVAAPDGTNNVTLHAVTISGNNAGRNGGGIYSEVPLTIDNSGGASVISTNTAGAAGGGIYLKPHDKTSNISGVTISGNTATGAGGGIRLAGSTSASVLNLSYARIVGNTASSGTGSGLSIDTGTANADKNWWGCNAGPSAAPCNTASFDSGFGSIGVIPWIVLTHTPASSLITTGTATTLTAGFLTNSDGTANTASNLGALIGLPITFNNAVLGALSSPQASIQSNGTATATFTAGASGGTGHADATVDSATVTADITIRPSTTITSITRTLPTDKTGDATVSWTVTFADAVAGLTGSNFSLVVGPGLTVSTTLQTIVTGGASAPATSWTVTATTVAGSDTLELDLVNDTNLDHSVTNLPKAGQSYTIDHVAPDTSVFLNFAVPTKSGSMSINYLGSDNVFVTGALTYECRLDGASFAACPGTNIVYNGLADGSHTFEARASDPAGNTDPTPASVTWTIDSTPPDTSIATRPASATNSTSASFSFSGDDGTGLGGLTFECKLDAAAFSACTSPTAFNSLAEGSHTFQVRATDVLGNVDQTPASHTWTVDTTPPDTSITDKPADPSHSATASFSFSGTDGSGVGGLTFQCSLDGGPFTACTSPAAFNGLVEGSHTLQVRATDAAGNVDPTPASYTWAIDTVQPTISIADVSTAEGNSGTKTLDFSVTLSRANFQTVSVQVATADGTATSAGNDYLPVPPTTLTWNVGDPLTKTVSVTMKGDTLSEPDETFTVNLTNPQNAAISKASATGTIQNDDLSVSGLSLSINDVTVAEGSTGTTSLAFTVTLSSPSGQTVTVVAQTADGTASSVSDYTAVGPTTLTFPPGATTQAFNVPISGDTFPEPDETVLVNLTNPTGATIGKPQGVGTIKNDDAQSDAVAIWIYDPSQPEGNSGTSNMTFTVELNRVSQAPVTVQYATADGTATVADHDYQATSGTLTFAPGELSKTISVPVTGDTKTEGDETFIVMLSSTTNAAIAKDHAIGVIVNDDIGVASVCSPRPPVVVTSKALGDGRLQVTVTAGTDGLNGANRLTELRFGPTTNALIDVAGQTGKTPSFTVPLSDRPASVTFFVRRDKAGQATTVPLVVVDTCGEWPTVVGGGPTAF